MRSIIAMAAWLGLSVGTVAAQLDSARRPVITTDGSATVTIPADQAVVAIAVIARDRTAAKAAQANAVVARALIDTLRAHGIPADSVTTTGYRVDPEIDRNGARPNLTSYVARSQVRVVLRDLSKVGAVLDAALASGANEVPQVIFQASHTDSARHVALAKAVTNAQADAQAAATAVGAQLGRILRLTIVNRGVYGGVGAFDLAQAVPARSVTTPITPSSITVSGDVSIEWELVERH